MHPLRPLLALLAVAGGEAFAPPAPRVQPPRSSFSSSLHSSLADDAPSKENTIDQYSRCLSPYEERQAVNDESSQYAIVDARPKWQSALLAPFKLAGKAAGKASKVAGIDQALGGKAKKPGALILLRCGESEWTRTGKFTGWADPDLVREGVLEIEHAGR